MAASIRIVCFGSSRVHPGDVAYETALEVGRVLGRRRLTVLSGGYQGTMEAVSRGADEEGGRVMGITTPIFRARVANAHVHEEFVEMDYPARLAQLLRQGHGYVALPGGLGTLSEWLSAWCLATIQQLPGPLWMFEEPWRPIVDAVMELPEVADGHGGHLRWVRDAEDLAGQLDAWLGGRSEDAVV